MLVPKDIRDVKRDRGTIVRDFGGSGPYRWGVLERNGYYYPKNGGKPTPKYGKTIGHIIDHKFVRLAEKEAVRRVKPTSLPWGASAFCSSVWEDIKEDFLSIFEAPDAWRILSMGSIKAIHPGITINSYAPFCRRNWISLFVEGAHLSKSTLDVFIERLGMARDKRIKYYEKRFSRIEPGSLGTTDVTKREDRGSGNTLGEWSYRAKKTGTKEISVAYAYDLNRLEPLCREAYPGNMSDSTALRHFVENCEIKDCVIVADRAFPRKKMRSILKQRPWLYYISPLKSKRKTSENLSLTNWQGSLIGLPHKVLFTKKVVRPGLVYYAFRDLAKAIVEEAAYCEKHTKDGTFDIESYKEAKEFFGVIIIESDLNTDPLTIYLAYDKRWLIELMFRKYKSDLDLDKTGMHKDESIMGDEFINLIATKLVSKMVAKAVVSGVLGKYMTWEGLIDALDQVWRKTDAPIDEMPMIYDRYWVDPIDSHFPILEKLGLVEVRPKKKRGRPRVTVV